LLLLNRTYNRIEELFEDYASGALHPDDVKPALAKAINQILQVNPSSLPCCLVTVFSSVHKVYVHLY